MGFFENLGRKVEEFKRTAQETAAEEATHVCRSCGERFYTNHDDCPECGAAVVARGNDAADGADSDRREGDDATIGSGPDADPGPDESGGDVDR